MSSVSSVFDEANNLLKDSSYPGAVSVYLMRYRYKTKHLESGNERVKFASFYDAKIDVEIQEKLLKNFVDVKPEYDGEDYEYLVNGEPSGGVGYVNVSTFSNVNNIYDSLEDGENISSDLSKMTVSSLKAYVVRLQLPNNKTIYYWGKINNYSNLQRKSFIMHKEYNSSNLKKFDTNDTFGFSFEIPAIIYDNKVYISKVSAFESIFGMSEHYMEEAVNVIKDVVESESILDEATKAIDKMARSNARLAKKVMKLKFKKEVVQAVYKNLNENIYNEIMQDSNIKDKYVNVTYSDGILGVNDPTDISQIYHLLDFIGDTAKRGIASKLTSSEAL